MTQILFGSNTAPTEPNLDQNFTQLYDLRELVSTPSYVAATPKLTIDSSFNFLFNRSSSTLNNTAGLGILATGTTFAEVVSAPGFYVNRLTTDGTAIEFRRQNVTVGSISVTGSATTYATSSDARLKTNIADATDAGWIIDAIKVRSFDWRAGDKGHVTHGFIAQELTQVAPDAVKIGDAGIDVAEAWGVDPSKLVALLVKELQSLRLRVAMLEAN